ncbi:hypothetical protein ABEB36_001111 [Hypothenemus hampei]|uniref:Uncharacterized protein n=1 Tax=Hypothenemus hampei TaxID=57062 RepID=A0ABD1FDH7_HYPHA
MSVYEFNDPPPPGTELEPPDDENLIELKKKSPVPHKSSRTRSHSRNRERKSHHKRSKSHSRRSRSRSRRRRSRSRRRRRKYSSSSRSRSRSPKKHRHSRRYSRSRSRGTKRRSYRSRSRSRSYRSDRGRKSPKSEREYNKYSLRLESEDVIKEEDMKIDHDHVEDDEDEEDDDNEATVPFKNDGSFLELFKKMQEEKAKEAPQEEEAKKPMLPAFGKRRGGKVLKTGMVAKVRNIEEDSNNAQDPWSVYMKEVRKYKEVHCDDDSKTRPLVK